MTINYINYFSIFGVAAVIAQSTGGLKVHATLEVATTLAKIASVVVAYEARTSLMSDGLQLVDVFKLMDGYTENRKMKGIWDNLQSSYR